jgi:trans-aconitate methyltransferase
MTATHTPTRSPWEDSAITYDRHTRRFGTHRAIAATLAAIAPPAPGAVLDFGCGPGNSTRLLREAYPAATIIGVDSSASMIGLARASTPAAATITYHLADLAEAAAPAALTQQVYDLVVCANSLFHVDDKPALLRALRPLLHENAAIVFSLYDTVFHPADPLTWPLRTRHDDTLMDLLLDALRRRGHDVAARKEDREILTEASLTRLFADAGFAVRCDAVRRLRRTPAERLSFFRVPSTAAEVFPDVPAAEVRAAADSILDTAADLPVQERSVYAFTASRSRS